MVAMWGESLAGLKNMGRGVGGTRGGEQIIESKRYRNIQIVLVCLSVCVCLPTAVLSLEDYPH